jgi:hypothetical protein
MGKKTIQSIDRSGHSVGNQQGQDGCGQHGHCESNQHIKDQLPELLSHELNKKRLGGKSGLSHQSLKEEVALHDEKHN